MSRELEWSPWVVLFIGVVLVWCLVVGLIVRDKLAAARARDFANEQIERMEKMVGE